jgi:hypothetical protein
MLQLSLVGLNVALPALGRKEPNIMRHSRPLITTFVVAAAAVAVLTAGCGGSNSHSSPNSSSFGGNVTQARAQYLGYAGCMRSHGVPGYPDPMVSGSADSLSVGISPGGANPNSPAFKSADRACHQLLPNGGAQGGPGGSSAQQQAQDVLFADCMRSHRVPSFPDPGHDGVLTLPATINVQAPAFLRATNACQKVEPSSLSINQAPGGP